MFHLNNISVATGGQPPAAHFTLVYLITGTRWSQLKFITLSFPTACFTENLEKLDSIEKLYCNETRKSFS